MDSQETFNTVADHLARQKMASVDGGGCMLRGQLGTKCAIGCLIPDVDYTHEMESDSGIRSSGLYREEPQGPMHTWLIRTLNPTPAQYELLRSLQIWHDNATSDSRATNIWSFGLAAVAYANGFAFDCAAFERNLADITYCYPISKGAST